MVQEKSGSFRGTGVWKFPTGVVDEVNSFGYALIPYLHINVYKILQLLRLIISRGKIYAKLQREKSEKRLV